MVITPCLHAFAGAASLEVAKSLTLVGTVAWFVATPMWMSREPQVDDAEVEIQGAGQRPLLPSTIRRPAQPQPSRTCLPFADRSHLPVDHWPRAKRPHSLASLVSKSSGYDRYSSLGRLGGFGR